MDQKNTNSKPLLPTVGVNDCSFSKRVNKKTLNFKGDQWKEDKRVMLLFAIKSTYMKISVGIPSNFIFLEMEEWKKVHDLVEEWGLEIQNEQNEQPKLRKPVEHI